MNVYICPICNCTLEHAHTAGRGYCPDCRAAYRLGRCMSMERVIPLVDRDRCAEVRQ